MLYFLTGTRETEVPGREARGTVNTAKPSAADALWEAVNAAVLTFGRYGLDAEYDAEGEFRETRLHRVALFPTNLISSCLAEHGLPRSV
jgi:acyl-CoA dehydrogenase